AVWCPCRSTLEAVQPRDRHCRPASDADFLQREVPVEKADPLTVRRNEWVAGRRTANEWRGIELVQSTGKQRRPIRADVEHPGSVGRDRDMAADAEADRGSARWRHGQSRDSRRNRSPTRGEPADRPSHETERQRADNENGNGES